MDPSKTAELFQFLDKAKDNLNLDEYEMIEIVQEYIMSQIRLNIMSQIRLKLTNKCEHEIVDARNKIVKSGYMCKKCGKGFASGDH